MARSLSLTLPLIFLTVVILAGRSWTAVATTPRARSCATAVGRSSASISPETRAPPERPRYAYKAMVRSSYRLANGDAPAPAPAVAAGPSCARSRSEEHTSELQSRFDLVCRLLLEKKKR